MGLKPEISAYLQDRAALGLPQVWQAPLAQIRENTKLHVALQQSLDEIYSCEHKIIQGPTSKLPIRIYRPSNLQNLPVLLFFHGGGWVLNFLDVYEPVLRKLSNLGNFVIVALEYQKAPEHPYPAAFNDCYATLEWLIDNAKQLDIDLTSVGVGGDSAGGNLASAVALKAVNENLISLAFQLLIYPCNDVKMEYPSAVKNAEGFGLTTKAMKWFWQQYLSNESDKKDPYAVPITAKSLKGVAPAILISAEFDPLADDVRNYYNKLQQDLVPAVYKEYAGQIHGFFNLSGITTDAESLYLDIATEINAILGRH
ncbi:MAG: alpha/beta hydrolase [Candidatus Nanopelagicus sp.]